MPRPADIRIVPIILAAGTSPDLPWPKALAPFGARTALQIVLANIRGLVRPTVVLGHRAAEVRPAIPPGVAVVVNSHWRRGQLSSLLAALRKVPRDSALLLYPVDYVLVTRGVINSLLRAYRSQPDAQILLPRYRGRAGHPAIFGPEVRRELARARTAREVVYRDMSRVRFISVNTAAIWKDFQSRASYARCVRALRRRRD